MKVHRQLSPTHISHGLLVYIYVPDMLQMLLLALRAYSLCMQGSVTL